MRMAIFLVIRINVEIQIIPTCRQAGMTHKKQ